jgi:hypothetical protein
MRALARPCLLPFPSCACRRIVRLVHRSGLQKKKVTAAGKAKATKGQVTNGHI